MSKFIKIEGKTYFLLDFNDDPVAMNSLLNYREEIKFNEPNLANEINEKLNESFENSI